MRKPIVGLCILAVCLVAVSCKKLGGPAKTTTTGPLIYEVKFTDAIPQNYGPLIGVTAAPEAPGWVGLWFQGADGTIIAVFVKVDEGKISNTALRIPRK